jgi:hypothetical protein
MSTELEMKSKQAIAERSAEANLLIKRLKQLKVGEVIDYAELNKLFDGDVQGKHRYLLETARRVILNEERVVLECVFGKGVKRLENDAIPAIAEQARTRINRISKGASKKLACVDYDKLTNEQRLDWNTHMSMMGALTLVTKTASVKQLRAAVSTQQERLPLNKTLEAFKS